MPVNPTNTPVAHPLAPNPHTSVGVFWIYTDPNTGRQWTGGTYKVKRCTGASCTPTTVVASGLTNADFQDTGRTANTTYGYSYVANDGVDSADSPVVYVTTRPSDENTVTFPNATWEELLGPLPETSEIPFSWYNSTATGQAQDIIAKFPVVGPSTIQGTGSINNGSNILTGSGTNFLEQVAANNPACLDAISIGGINAGAIASVDSNTQITLVNNWTGSNQSGAALSTNVTGLCGFNDPFSDYLTGNQLMYYDSPMAMWQIYFATGDPQYLRGAIKGSESIFAGYMWLGRNRGWSVFSTTTNHDNIPAPRNFQFSGYVLLGMAGRSDIWDLLDDYLTARYPTWISNYRGGNNNFMFMREKAYMILFTSWFVTAAPDSFKRSDGTTTTANGTITVDGSLATGRKGWWRDQLDIDIPGFITDDQLAHGQWMELSYYADYSEGEFPYPAGLAQPFITGLVGDSLGFCWRNSRLATNTRNAARKLVLRAAAFLGHLTYNSNIVADDTSIRNRGVYYLFGGGTKLNPYAFNYGSDFNSFFDFGSNIVSWDRQSIPLMLSTFGWAWEMSGISWYKTMGEEMANAAFAEVGENTGGTGDGKKCLCHVDSNYKDFGQCYRTSRRFFGQRLLSPSQLSTPPTVNMPSNQTLSNGINQVSLTASVTCPNAPCTYRWGLKEYPLVDARHTSTPVFNPDNALTTQLSGLESGPYKLVFYALDSLGLVGSGEVTITAGDGQFPPIVLIGDNQIPPFHSIGISGTSVTGKARAYSIAGRTLTHSFTFKKPKDAPNPTISPDTTTGNIVNLTVSGLQNGYYEIIDTVTDSAGLVRKAVWIIQKNDSPMVPPSSEHNTVPDVAVPLPHILPSTSSSTILYVAPIDPEGYVNFGLTNPGAGYSPGQAGGAYTVDALTHSWSQIAGPVSATITNGNTVRPTITGLTQPGLYTFQYTGTDPQGDSATASVDVTVLNSGVTICRWSTTPVCQ